MRTLFVFSVALISALNSFSQIRKIPAVVTDAFTRQYTNVSQVEYEDFLVQVNVHFVSDSTKMIAKYNNDGSWKETEKQWSFDNLPGEVKDGFAKSKYSTEWKVTEAAIIYLPKDELRYRVKVEKGELQKKYLFFDKTGRMVKETLTI